MTASSSATIAKVLATAQETRDPVPPLIEAYPDLTLDDAYAVQLHNVHNRVERGERIVGHKVGLTSLAMQQALGVHEPDFGHLFAGMFEVSHGSISVEEYIAPRIEPEIAFVMGSPLEGPGLTIADVMRAVEFVVPSLEIIDSRIADWKISLVDTVADNASSAGVVLAPQPHRLLDHDLATVPCSLERNGEVVATGLGSDVLGHPLHALLWLANRIGEFGTRIEAGHVVLPGSCTKAMEVHAGDAFVARFGPLGTVTASFSKEAP